MLGLNRVDWRPETCRSEDEESNGVFLVLNGGRLTVAGVRESSGGGAAEQRWLGFKPSHAPRVTRRVKRPDLDPSGSVTQ